MKVLLMLVIATVLLVEFSHEEARVPSKTSGSYGRPSRRKPTTVEVVRKPYGGPKPRPPKEGYETSGKQPPKGEGEGEGGEGNYEGEEEEGEGEHAKGEEVVEEEEEEEGGEEEDEEEEE